MTSRARALADELRQVSGSTLSVAMDMLGHDGRRRLREALTESSNRNRDDDKLTAKLRSRETARRIIDIEGSAYLSNRTYEHALGGEVHWMTAEALVADMPRTYEIYADPDSTGRRIRRRKKRTS